MLTQPGEFSLRVQSGLPMLVIGEQILIGGAGVRPQLFVFGRPARTVQSGVFRAAAEMAAMEQVGRRQLPPDDRGAAAAALDGIAGSDVGSCCGQ